MHNQGVMYENLGVTGDLFQFGSMPQSHLSLGSLGVLALVRQLDAVLFLRLINTKSLQFFELSNFKFSGDLVLS